jgi:hypothetical protein
MSAGALFAIGAGNGRAVHLEGYELFGHTEPSVLERDYLPCMDQSDPLQRSALTSRADPTFEWPDLRATHVS